jgi:hypothetical protein
MNVKDFLILTHAQVADYIRNKAENYDHWLHSLRKMRRVNQALKMEKQK